MLLIVGLGNPGDKYSNTRHNTGFRALKELAQKHDITETEYHHNALQAKGKIAEKKVVLAQPNTYMNKSGRAVKQLLTYYDLAPENMLVLHDDLDLPVGKIRIKQGGGAAGHNGLKSIINYINSREFNRLRLGIGRPPDGVEVSNYVLTVFNQKEEKKMKLAISEMINAIKVIIVEGYEEAMNRFN